jgi:hypothetical protein
LRIPYFVPLSYQTRWGSWQYHYLSGFRPTACVKIVLPKSSTHSSPSGLTSLIASRSIEGERKSFPAVLSL